MTSPPVTPPPELRDLAAALKKLRAGVNNPTYDAMVARAKETGVKVVKSSLSRADKGLRLPGWKVMQAYVLGCKDNPADWRGRWESARAAVDGTRPRPVAVPRPVPASARPVTPRQFPDPATATTPADFRTLLQDLYRGASLASPRLAVAKARSLGVTLSRGAIQNLIDEGNNTSVPRLATVKALLAVCDVPPDRCGAWLERFDAVNRRGRAGSSVDSRPTRGRRRNSPPRRPPGPRRPNAAPVHAGGRAGLPTHPVYPTHAGAVPGAPAADDLPVDGLPVRDGRSAADGLSHDGLSVRDGRSAADGLSHDGLSVRDGRSAADGLSHDGLSVRDGRSAGDGLSHDGLPVRDGRSHDGLPAHDGLPHDGVPAHDALPAGDGPTGDGLAGHPSAPAGAGFAGSGSAPASNGLAGHRSAPAGAGLAGGGSVPAGTDVDGYRSAGDGLAGHPSARAGTGLVGSRSAPAGAGLAGGGSVPAGTDVDGYRSAGDGLAGHPSARAGTGLVGSRSAPAGAGLAGGGSVPAGTGVDGYRSAGDGLAGHPSARAGRGLAGHPSARAGTGLAGHPSAPAGTGLAGHPSVPAGLDTSGAAPRGTAWHRGTGLVPLLCCLLLLTCLPATDTTGPHLRQRHPAHAVPDLPAVLSVPATPAHDELLALAATARGSADPFADGRYTHVRTQTWCLDTTAFTTTGIAPGADPVRATEDDLWWTPDGRARESSIPLPGLPAGDRHRDRRSPVVAPARTVYDHPAGEFSLAVSDPSVSPTELADQLSRHNPVTNGPHATLQAVSDMYKQQHLSDVQRAAVLQVLAGINGLQNHGTATDRAGRPGIAISADTPDGTARHLAIFDRETGDLLSYEEIILVSPPRTSVRAPILRTYVLYLAHSRTDTQE